jgi:hypothetical protein
MGRNEGEVTTQAKTMAQERAEKPKSRFYDGFAVLCRGDFCREGEGSRG